MARTTMKVTEVADLIGRTCHWIVPTRGNPGAGDIMVVCHIREARIQFGRTEVLIRPAEGHGSRWVYLDAVELL